MKAYLFVNVDDLLEYAASSKIDLQELAVAIRANAIIVAGLYESTLLRAVAFGDWSAHKQNGAKEPLAIFQNAGYETSEVSDPQQATDLLVAEYFPPQHGPVSWLILAATGTDLLGLLPKVSLTDDSRIRLWGANEAALAANPLRERIVVQRLDSLVGIQRIRNVAVYVDFENISISLNEQGYVVNLDHLISRMVAQAQAHGQLVKMAAYAPWGQRGALPPLVDSGGREVADDAPSRLMKANIDPVFHLPGKQSADIRIARDVLADADYPESGDVIILATGDRDFNDVINTLLQKRKTVVVWGVRGSTGRLLQDHPSLRLDYIDDFTDFQTHQSLSDVETAHDTESFIPSQWSSVIIQFFHLSSSNPQRVITVDDLITQLGEAGGVISQERGRDLVSQAIALGILTEPASSGDCNLNYQHPIVDKTLLIVNRLVRARRQHPVFAQLGVCQLRLPAQGHHDGARPGPPGYERKRPVALALDRLPGARAHAAARLGAAPPQPGRPGAGHPPARDARASARQWRGCRAGQRRYQRAEVEWRAAAPPL